MTAFFAWNFFDAILQQKEGYSDYRWEDIAARVLKNNPGLQQKLNDKKRQIQNSLPMLLHNWILFIKILLTTSRCIYATLYFVCTTVLF